jgi:hypothetical protein
VFSVWVFRFRKLFILARQLNVSQAPTAPGRRTLPPIVDEMTTEDDILQQIDRDRVVAFTKDDSEERFKALDRLRAFELVYEQPKYQWRLTDKGYKAVSIGFDNFINLNNDSIDSFALVLLALKKHSNSGEFIDLSKERLPFESKTLKSICDLLKKENKIEIKANGEYAMVFGDGTTFNNVKGNILARITPTGLQYLKQGDNSVNIGNILVIDGEGNNVNQSRSDNARESPTIQTNKPTKETKPAKTSWLEKVSWVTAIILFIMAVYEFIIKHILLADK